MTGTARAATRRRRRLADEPSAESESAMGNKTPLMIDDFESYKPGDNLPWHRTPHGNAMTVTIGEAISGKGRQSIKLTYVVGPGEGKTYAAAMRYQKWDLDGYDGLRFWLKTDGRGHHLGICLNMLDEQGRQVWNLWNSSVPTAVGDTSTRQITVPFSSFKQDLTWASVPDVSPEFVPANLTEIVFLPGLWKGEERYGESVLYIDDLEAVGLERDAALDRSTEP